MESKPYLVLARKYRPRTFDEVVGQEAAATTLKNAVTMQRIGHAYLFTGPRGVGKTSMARIFAKALNCQNGPTVTPCGKCVSCTEIDAGRALDVLEIDGASNRGIDEIRALRESVRFSPSSGKYKIYIIDEVHQITTDGFNALLKTLEEPPAHVKFIFATTSAQKVPATILSRCQRFDFRRIPTERIAQVLRDLCKKEKIKADDEALFVIAQAADGSLRDSQTILDQIAASGDGKIAKDDVIRSLGVLEEDRLAGIMQALSQKDAAKALTLLDETLKEGKDPVLFLEKMLEHVRNLLFVHVSADLLDLVDATESYKKALLKQKEALNRDELFYFFSVLSHAVQTLRRFDMKRIPIEVALIKLACRVPMQSVAELLEGLAAEKKTPVREELRPAPRPAASAAPVAPPKKAAKPDVDEEDEDIPEIEELSGDKEVLLPLEKASGSLDAVWEALIQAVKSEKISAASYLADGQPYSLKEGVAIIGFPPKLNFFKETLELNDNKRLIEKHLGALLHADVRVQFETMKELAKPEDAEEPKRAPALPPEENPALKSAINILGGRVIQ
jgi:DNA polymerase III subunit gamma/tau